MKRLAEMTTSSHPTGDRRREPGYPLESNGTSSPDRIAFCQLELKNVEMISSDGAVRLPAGKYSRSGMLRRS